MDIFFIAVLEMRHDEVDVTEKPGTRAMRS
jgi:hypothetical protein